MKELIPKRMSRAFGKIVYLLGEDKDGTLYWLEEPEWDCGWYWGFGYVETYTNNANPSASKDVESHQHIDSSFMGKQEYYDIEKHCWKLDSNYIHNIYDSPKFTKTTFTENEGWKLSELFKQFYLLKDMAEFAHKDLPGCHVTTSPVNHGNLSDWYNKINKEMIPRITKEIIKMLTPE